MQCNGLLSSVDGYVRLEKRSCGGHLEIIVQDRVLQSSG